MEKIDFLIHPLSYILFVLENLIRNSSYSLDIHKITTSDGYILTAWRIQSKRTPKQMSPHPVLLVHGLLDCSFSWFVNKDQKSTLPFMLADRGLDVWVINNRGTKFSLEHEKIQNPLTSAEFWDFSLDELAKYDVPAFVAYVKQQT